VKLPYIKWYFRDASADLRLLDAVPRCVWYEMLWLMAAADRYGYLEWAGHPMTDIEIARASGLTADEIAAARPVLIAAGIPSVEPETGAWFCRRMVDDEARRQKCSEAGKRGGGSPLLASSPEATELCQNPEPRTHISVKVPLKVTFKGDRKQELEDTFNQFYAAYPKKEDKQAAIRAWPKVAHELPAILAALEWQRVSDRWQEKQYIPNPSTYLNKRRWEDDPAGYKRTVQHPGLDESRIARGRTAADYAAAIVKEGDVI